MVKNSFYPMNTLYRGSYTSVQVLLNSLNELGKRDKMRGWLTFYLFFAAN